MAPNIAPARLNALKILRRVEQEQGNSDTLLHSRNVDALSPSDRNLCTAIVLGTLRWQRVLDEQCRRFLVRPNNTIRIDAQVALRAGAYQLQFLDRIPAHAAIFESVEWTKRSEAVDQAGVVNAILRKVATLPKRRVIDAIDAYPRWMTTRWSGFYGAEACRKICEYGQAEHPTAVRPADSVIADKGATKEIKLRRGYFLDSARYFDEYSLQEASALNQFHFQDEGSQLIAELLGHGERILDCCAAPGGKTLILRHNNPNAQLMACDVNAARLTSMQERLATRLDNTRTNFRVADAAKLSGVGQFDRILCDVPCSGTGTLSRNPEIRHRIRQEDLARQACRQREILLNALSLLAPGGRLLYSTCSLEPEENESVVETCVRSANAKGQKIRCLNLAEEFDHLERTGVVGGEAVSALRTSGFINGYLRTVPGMHPCDGFFAALLERD